MPGLGHTAKKKVCRVPGLGHTTKEEVFAECLGTHGKEAKFAECLEFDTRQVRNVCRVPEI